MAEISAPKPEDDCCAQERGFLCWRVWVVYALLALVGIPWYWPKDHADQLFGLPAWTCVSLLASLGASVLTSWLILTHWPAPSEDDTNSNPS